MDTRSNLNCDVAIVGGGPAGATAATLLRKYAPALRVLVLERETFPREHVGESQLPSISPILAEMGVWDRVEAEGFPIKIGASYTWGRDHERWDFDFYPLERWRDEERPAKFEGQRTFTAFQVDRARYDELLLCHARSCGAEVREGISVDKVLVEGEHVRGLKLSSGESVTANHYIDATGVSATLRRALGIGSDAPESLRNIAVWDYWTNAEWAVEIGVGATRVQVRSLPYGWIWFIPLGPTRTSIGLICPARYYKQSGRSAEALYREALKAQPDIAKLIANATAEGQIRTCKDWSHLAHRIAGPNWFLCGEAAGFADPILAAGMSLAHASARDAAYTILELERGEIDAGWLRARYNDHNRTSIDHHIRFAQYWYSANGFTELQEHCREIAREAGLTLTPKQAWQWLSQGSFTSGEVGHVSIGSFDVASTKNLLQFFDPERRSSELLCNGVNVFNLDVTNAERGVVGQLKAGRIHRIECYRKGRKVLPLAGYYKSLVDLLQRMSDATVIVQALQRAITRDVPEARRRHTFVAFIQALEVMIQDGWVRTSRDPRRPVLSVGTQNSRYIRDSAEARRALDRAGVSNVRYNV
jgi:flavin-dependent dehydrogenase